MKNLKVAKKLLLSFGIVVLLGILAVICSVILGMNTMKKQLDIFYNQPYQITSRVGDLRFYIQTIRLNQANIIMESKGADISNYVNEISENTKNFDLVLYDLQQIMTDEAAQEKIQEINEVLPKMVEVRKRINNALAIQDRETAGQILIDEFGIHAQRITDLVNELEVIANTLATETYASANQAAFTSNVIVFSFSALCFIFALFLCFNLTNSIRKPLEEIETAAKELSEGNFEVTVDYQSKDELGSLADSIRTVIQSLKLYIENISTVLGNVADGDLTVTVDIDYKNDFAPIKTSMEHIIDSLNSIVSQILTSAQQVSVGSEQVSAGAQTLSSGSAEQAGSVEELVSTLIEVSKKVKYNADNAVIANQSMDETSQKIQNEQDKMQQLVQAMEDIANTSDEVRKIIRTIDDIAFQTNILALNAAVEAARAGEAGKGFAVVADEVRNLASKSAEAAKNTTVLIDNTLAAVENGSRMVDTVKESLDAVVEKANEVTGLISDISISTQEQAVAIDQINQSVSMISGIVQSNSATAEESAASSEELSGQAEVLQTLVEHFKLKNASDSSYTTPQISSEYRQDEPFTIDLSLDKY